MLTVVFLLTSCVFQCYSLFGDRLLNARNPAIGPCTLNDDGLKCNKHGYYEIVQCNSDSCFCVTPHNALVAYDSHTDNPKKAPKCGTCFVYLQKLFVNGDPPKNSFVPKCDVGKGDFEPVQCDSQKNQCYCADTTTGREIPGTRKPLSGTKMMNCMKTDFSIDSESFPTFQKPDSETPYIEEPLGRPHCALNRDAGLKCNENKTSIRYWFDKETFQCFPFEHKGCGGNQNSYRTSHDCYSDCVLQDDFSCAMQSHPARKSNGQPYSCGQSIELPPGFSTTIAPGPALSKDGCPKGYECNMGPFFGICCDKRLSDRYNAAFKPVCKNKKAVLQKKIDDWLTALLGKSCSDRFCPSSHSCEQNEFFAYCCQK